MSLKKLLIPDSSNGYYPYIIRKSALFVFTLTLFLFNILSPLIFIEDSRVVASTISIDNIVALTNKERVNSGLNSLSNDVRLNAAALAKANDMLAKDYWDHFGPNGETPWQFISGAGYTYVYAGENLAKGFVTAEGVHQAWMSSPTHKANIMNSNYRDIGVAVIEGKLQGDNVILVVQMFGSTVATKPTPDTTVESPTVKAEESKPDTVKVESGFIKSISIERPLPQEVVTDPTVNVEGTVDGYVSNLGEYTVVVNRNGLDIASGSSSASDWAIDKKSDWEEGPHEIRVFIQGQEHISDELEFSVDSTPPTFYIDSLSVRLIGNHAQVSIYVEEEDAILLLNLGNDNYGFAHEGEGIFTAYVPRSSIETSDVKAYLMISDVHGNSTGMDVSQRLALLADGGERFQTVSTPSLLTSLFSGLGSLSIRAKVNLGFALFLIIILVIQVVLYRKSGMLHERGGYLLTTGVFLFLVIVGTLTEVTGSIN